MFRLGINGQWKRQGQSVNKGLSGKENGGLKWCVYVCLRVCNLGDVIVENRLHVGRVAHVDNVVTGTIQ